MSETPARDEMLDFALAAFKDSPNPVVSAHANKLADAFEAEARAAAPSAPAARAAVLTADERAMLSFALDLAQDRIFYSGPEFTADDQVAIDRLRRIADRDAAAEQPAGARQADTAGEQQ